MVESNVVVLLLAAGSSQRMGEQNKLLLPSGGGVVLEHALDVSTQSKADSVYVVTGYQRDLIWAVAREYSVEEIFNAEYAQGQDRSITVGMRRLEGMACSVVVMLADQPTLSVALLDSLIDRHLEDGGERALVPVYNGRWGTPRVLPCSLVEMAASGGSLRRVLKSGEVEVHTVDVGDASVLRDIDSPNDYQRFILGE